MRGTLGSVVQRNLHIHSDILAVSSTNCKQTKKDWQKVHFLTIIANIFFPLSNLSFIPILAFVGIFVDDINWHHHRKCSIYSRSCSNGLGCWLIKCCRFTYQGWHKFMGKADVTMTVPPITFFHKSQTGKKELCSKKCKCIFNICLLLLALITK